MNQRSPICNLPSFTDLKKMPLGKLSKVQIGKGFDVLEELEAAINANKNNQLDQLTSKFYTLIPHDFGRQRPPIIRSLETIRQKKDMLLVGLIILTFCNIFRISLLLINLFQVLADIELAQSLQKEKKAPKVAV